MIMRVAFAILARAVVGMASLLGADTLRAADATTEVMIVGMIHMANPGRDRDNMLVPDVLLPQYQAEIARMTEGLARFKPTQVHVESEREMTTDYSRYLAGELQSDRNEIVQVAFRLAKQAGLANVHASDTAMSFDFGPLLAFAAAHDKKALLEDIDAKFKAKTAIHEEIIRTRGLLAELRHHNLPGEIFDDHVIHRMVLPIGAGSEQPGADYWAGWSRRNILICAKIIQAAKPGDRLVVFFGAAHSYLLRQCVAETPGFKLVEANDYLPEP
jgi:Family of unknown function (DUF5694)